MARKPLITKESYENGIINEQEKESFENELTDLVNLYVTEKSKLDEIKKNVDSTNRKIKELMTEHNISSFEGEDGSVKLSISEQKSFDEGPMIEWMKKKKVVQWAIKTKEYIDIDELENAIYSGKVDDVELVKMKDFEIIKKVQKLTISKKKGEKE